MRLVRKPYGKINLIGLVLILAVVGAIYAVVILSGPYVDNMDVKEKVDAAYNQSHRRTDDELKKFIVTETSTFGEHDEDDGFGNVKTVRGLGITPDNITIERNDVTNTILIRVDYDRKVILSPTNKVKYIHMHVQHQGPIPER